MIPTAEPIPFLYKAAVYLVNRNLTVWKNFVSKLYLTLETINSKHSEGYKK